MTYKVYSQPGCPPCENAKALLRAKNLEYNEINIRENKDALTFIVEEMTAFGLRPTTPQVYSPEGKRIGGYDDLVEYFKEQHAKH
jgi:glutaredoxin